jgi:hypothetical protein
MLIVQLLPAVTVGPHVVVSAKSVLGLIKIPFRLLIFRVASPIFLRVTTAGLLVVFIFWLPNETDIGFRLTFGAGITVCMIAVEVLVTKLPSPLYVAVMLSGPLSGRLDMLNVAWSGHGAVPQVLGLSVEVPIEDPLL